MPLANRIRCFVEVAILMLAAAAPSLAQISAHGYLSDCDQKKVPPGYANDLKSPPWWTPQKLSRTASAQSDVTPSSLAKYCLAEFLLEKHEYQASVNAYRDSLAGDGESRLDQSLELHPDREDLRHHEPARTGPLRNTS